MSSKIVKLSANGRRTFVDPKPETVGPANRSLSLRKRKRASESKNECLACSRKTLLKNHSNFMKSSFPRRLLFSQDGQWVDFSQEVVDFVKEGFQSKRSAIEVKCNGCHFMLDILHMVHVDLKTGAQKPIAWIDDGGNCVFPEMYSGCRRNHEDLVFGESSSTQEIGLQLEIELKGLNNNKDEECVGVSNAKRIKVDPELPDNNQAFPYEEKQKSDECASPVIETTCGTVDVETARNMFITCLGSDLKIDFLEVKKCSSSFMEARFDLFEKQVEITQKLRGKANVQYGWLTVADGAPSRVMFYGHNGPKLGRYGYGVHLAAVQSASLGATVFDVDEKGINHVVLCRVILGNAEVVHAGSKQFYPSDRCFDNGVDDLKNPNSYVIWNINMNSHIFPECVVSFKISSTVKGNPVGEASAAHSSRVTTVHDPHGPLNHDSFSNKVGQNDHQFEVLNLPPNEKVKSAGLSTSKGPKSAWMPFSTLFESISAKIAPNDMKLVHIFYESFRARKMNREEFIRKLRSIVGDQILRSTLSVLQTKVPNCASLPESKEVQGGIKGSFLGRIWLNVPSHKC